MALNYASDRRILLLLPLPYQGLEIHAILMLLRSQIPPNVELAALSGRSAISGGQTDTLRTNKPPPRHPEAVDLWRTYWYQMATLTLTRQDSYRRGLSGLIPRFATHLGDQTPATVSANLATGRNSNNPNRFSK